MGGVMRESYPVRCETYQLVTRELFRDTRIQAPFEIGTLPFVYGANRVDEASTIGIRSVNHGRASVDLLHDKLDIWYGPNHIPLSAREGKGNTIPDFMDLEITDGELWGILTKDEAFETLPILEWLRSIGLPTEVVAVIHAVDMVPMGGEFLPVNEAKQWYLAKIRLELSQKLPVYDALVGELAASLGLPVEEFKKEQLWFWKEKIHEQNRETFNQCYFLNWTCRNIQYALENHVVEKAKIVAIERHLTIGERVSDLESLSSLEEYQQALRPVFRILNVISETQGNLLTDLPTHEHFNADRVDDVRRYFSHFLPMQMGAYLGVLHAHYVAHANAHGSNWVLAGFAVDPDSMIGVIKGKTYGDLSELDTKMRDDTWVAQFIIFNTLARFLEKSNLDAFHPDDVTRAMKTYFLSYLAELIRHGVFERDFHSLRTWIHDIRVTRFSAHIPYERTLDDEIWHNVYASFDNLFN